MLVLNRYMGSISIYSNAFSLFIKPATDVECSVFYYFQQISNIIETIAICSIFTLRTFAIYGRNWTVLIVLVIPSFALLASNTWETLTQTALALPLKAQIGPNTCTFNASSSLFASNLLSFISLAVFDVLVVALTVYRTVRLAIRSKEGNIRGSLSLTLLRDGILYYAAIFIPTYVVIALDAVYMRNGSVNIGFISDDLTLIIDALQVVVVNRLVFNLSHTANARQNYSFLTRTGFGTPVFASNSVLGDFGGPVRTLLDELYEDEVGSKREGENENVIAEELVVRSDDFGASANL